MIEGPSGRQPVPKGALERCVGDVGSFIASTWSRAPLLCQDSPLDGFDDLLTLEDIDGILAERGLRWPAVRLVRDGRTLPPASYTKTARLQSRTVDDLIDPGRVFGLFSDGATVVLQALHRYWAPLAHFCRELEVDLTHPAQTNVYLTPPSSRGLDVHYDTHDVFVLQISGVKHWEVYGRAIDDPLAHQKRKELYVEPGPPQIDVELKPGQCLYIPRGFLHGAETGTAQSAHLTIGILSYTWMDFIRQAVEKASLEPRFRAALPPGFATPGTDTRRQAEEKLRQFTSWAGSLDPDTLMAPIENKFWSTRAPLLSGQLRQLLDLDALTDDARVSRRKGAICVARRDGDDLILSLGDRRVRVPAYAEPAIRHILDHPDLTVSDLEEHLDSSGRLTLVRRLIAEGLLEQSFG